MTAEARESNAPDSIQPYDVADVGKLPGEYAHGGVCRWEHATSGDLVFGKRMYLTRLQASPVDDNEQVRVTIRRRSGTVLIARHVSAGRSNVFDARTEGLIRAPVFGDEQSPLDKQAPLVWEASAPVLVVADFSPIKTSLPKAEKPMRTKLKLTPEAAELRRRENLAADIRKLADFSARVDMFLAPPTDRDLDAIADACNEILNGIDQWLDDREDALVEAGWNEKANTRAANKRKPKRKRAKVVKRSKKGSS